MAKSLVAGGVNVPIRLDPSQLKSGLRDAARLIDTESAKIAVRAKEQLKIRADITLDDEAIERRIGGMQRRLANAARRSRLENVARNRLGESGVDAPEDRDQRQFRRYLSDQKDAAKQREQMIVTGILAALAATAKIAMDTFLDVRKISETYRLQAARVRTEAGFVGGAGFGSTADTMLMGARLSERERDAAIAQRMTSFPIVGQFADWATGWRSVQLQEGVEREKRRIQARETAMSAIPGVNQRFAGLLGDPLMALQFRQREESRQQAIAAAANPGDPQVRLWGSQLAGVHQGEQVVAQRGFAGRLAALEQSTRAVSLGTDATFFERRGDTALGLKLRIRSERAGMESQFVSELGDSVGQVRERIMARQSAVREDFNLRSRIRVEDFAESGGRGQFVGATEAAGYGQLSQFAKRRWEMAGGAGWLGTDKQDEAPRLLTIMVDTLSRIEANTAKAGLN